jgi:hypothetical protein
LPLTSTADWSDPFWSNNYSGTDGWPLYQVTGGTISGFGEPGSGRQVIGLRNRIIHGSDIVDDSWSSVPPPRSNAESES